MNAHSTSPASADKLRRIKRTIIQNMSYSLINYCLAPVLTVIAVWIDLSSMHWSHVVVLGGVGSAVTLGCMGLVMARTHISNRFSLMLMLGQYIVFLAIFAVWVALLAEARFISLFVIVVSCLFLVFESTLVQSITVVSVICLTYAGAAWYGVAHLGQQSSLVRDLFMLGCFAPIGVMVSFIARSFRNQRRGLAQAKRQSDEARRELEEAHKALWGEMELAKKIQTVLLPDEPAITGFEIAAYMKPADEVGGDYYDIINVGGRDWVVIGDVSGHGVPAGLIMMIVQTAIKMVLAQRPDIDPSELLTLINRTIAGDIKKISEDKYMTITVLALHQEGRFYFSGLHQDIIVYRGDSGRVETVATDGMWLGIVPEIGDMMRDSTLSIGVGDVMMVFTDGVTEAWRRGSVEGRRDPRADMFGQSRLIEIVERSAVSGPEAVKQAILADLADYQTRDDVTFVILKRVR